MVKVVCARARRSDGDRSVTREGTCYDSVDGALPPPAARAGRGWGRSYEAQITASQQISGLRSRRAKLPARPASSVHPARARH